MPNRNLFRRHRIVLVLQGLRHGQATPPHVSRLNSAYRQPEPQIARVFDHMILTPVVQTQSSVQTKGQHLSTLQLALSTAAAAAAAVEIGGSSRKSPAQINKRTTKIVRNRGLGGLGERPSLDRGNLRQGRRQNIPWGLNSCSISWVDAIVTCITCTAVVPVRVCDERRDAAG